MARINQWIIISGNYSGVHIFLFHTCYTFLQVYSSYVTTKETSPQTISDQIYHQQLLGKDVNLFEFFLHNIDIGGILPHIETQKVRNASFCSQVKLNNWWQSSLTEFASRGHVQDLCIISVNVFYIHDLKLISGLNSKIYVI